MYCSRAREAGSSSEERIHGSFVGPFVYMYRSFHICIGLFLQMYRSRAREAGGGSASGFFGNVRYRTPF